MKTIETIKETLNNSHEKHMQKLTERKEEMTTANGHKDFIKLTITQAINELNGIMQLAHVFINERYKRKHVSVYKKVYDHYISMYDFWIKERKELTKP